MRKLNHLGFSGLSAILLVVVALLIGGTGWYVWKTNNKSDDTSSQTTTSAPESSEKSEAKSTAPISTDDWATYSNAAGVFRLKHPKSWAEASRPELCTEGLALFGANSDSVGVCASENGGQMMVYSLEGNRDDELILTDDYYSDIKTTLAEVDGIQGSRKEGTAKGQMSDEGPGGLPDGTKVVQYVFVANNDRTYMAQYVQGSGYPDVLAEFDVMVTKTLKFSL